MFWIFILIVSLASIFAQLGAYSVWVTILSFCLKLVMLVMFCLGITLLWRKVFGKKRLETDIQLKQASSQD